MPAPLIPDADLVRRAQAIIGNYTASRVEIIGARPGNPLRAEVRRFGAALATRAPPFGEHLFNRAIGFTDANLEAAAQVVDWYAEAPVAGVFEIAPGLENDRLMELLAARGYRQVRFHGAFAGPSELPQVPSPGVEVRQVSSDADLASFSDAYHLGWANAGPPVPMRPWLTAPGWSLYLALCDGAPAGAAILYRLSGDAYLADSAVDPAFRRRGVHRALLDRRCADAASASDGVVFAGADYLSASSRNMVRKGLAVLYTKAIWRAPPPL